MMSNDNGLMMMGDFNASVRESERSGWTIWTREA